MLVSLLVFFFFFNKGKILLFDFLLLVFQNDNKMKVIQNLIIHDAIGKRKVVLDQLREGLQTLGFGARLSAYPTGGDSSNKGLFREKNKLSFCRESGNQGSFSGNMGYFRDIEQRFDITCYQTIYIQ